MERRFVSGFILVSRFAANDEWGHQAGCKAAFHPIHNKRNSVDLVPTRLKAFPGAVDLVRACRNDGFKIAVASSADFVKIEANLNSIGLPAPFWNAVVSAEDARNKKPAPDIFLAAAAKMRLAPEQCVVIEDAVNGVQAAKAAGMRCVAVAQTFPRDALHAADVVKPSIEMVTMADLTG